MSAGEVRPDGVRFGIALWIGVAFSLFLVGVTATVLTLTVNGWLILAALGVVMLWPIRHLFEEPQPPKAVSPYFEGEWIE